MKKKNCPLAASHHPLREFSATQNGKYQYSPSTKTSFSSENQTKWKESEKN